DRRRGDGALGRQRPLLRARVVRAIRLLAGPRRSRHRRDAAAVRLGPRARRVAGHGGAPAGDAARPPARPLALRVDVQRAHPARAAHALDRAVRDARPAPARVRPPGGRALAAGVALVTACAFLPTLRNGFIDLDDQVNVVANPWIRALGPAELRWMLTTFHLGHWQPLSWVTLALDYRV